MLALGANPNTRIVRFGNRNILPQVAHLPDSLAHTVLMSATLRGHKEIVELLLDKSA